ncbi:hypothetical protein BJY20_002602 [Janibacter cremeus]|uniref:Uncharacterized protein n=1 Tax=Janibacter cremeus TaxID=1285192 RepID=A0A852VUX3_9MICO|nr:hypothetical protein [Janibacter cremeus]
MERFISTAKGCQMLTQERTVTYRAGMRATPVYALTVPAEKVGAPSDLDSEFQALAEMSLQMADLDGWQNRSDEPPDWAIGR